MKTTVDAFGTEVVIDDIVVFKGQHKYLEKGLVIKCTPHGATVICGIHKANVRSERIYKVFSDQQRLNLEASLEYSKEYIDVLRVDDGQQVIQ
jgi:hypothetical protein